MRQVARFFALLSAGLSLITLVRPSPGLGMALTIPRMVAGGLSPLLAVAGGLGALLGLAGRDGKAVAAGLVGVIVAARHVRRVTAPHDGFAQAFGRDWPARIPPHLWARFLPRRYTPRRFDPPDVPWQRDLVIASHHETGDPLLADLWQPPAGVSRTGLGIIYLHGSGWHYMDKDMGSRPFFRYLAGQGHVILDVAYTLAPKAGLHAMIADVKRAIAWMKTHAPGYGINPERVILMGGSAGAHLALLAAYTPNHPAWQPADVTTDTSVRAVVAYYGIGDLVAAHDYFRRQFERVAGRGGLVAVVASVSRGLLRIRQAGPLLTPPQMLPSLLGGQPDEVPALYRFGSPLTHVGPGCPPTLLLHGTYDCGVEVTQSRRLAAALRAVGVPVLCVEFAGCEHAFDLVFSRWSPGFQAATYDVERFLSLMI